MSKNKALLDSWKKLQTQINTFVKENNIDDLQKSVKKLVADAQKDISKVVDQDVNKVKSKFKKEARTL